MHTRRGRTVVGVVRAQLRTCVAGTSAGLCDGERRVLRSAAALDDGWRPNGGLYDFGLVLLRALPTRRYNIACTRCPCAEVPRTRVGDA
jgi:hypothetical protein